MTLRQAIASDVLTVFANTDDFAEPVTYRLRAGSVRSVNAVVFRQSYTTEDGIVRTMWEVHVPNHATAGVLASELALGADTIALAPREGKAAEVKTVTELLDHDNGMLILQCR